MHEGVILADGPPEKVLTASRLTDVYGVPVRVERTESGSAVCAPWVVDASTGSGLQHHETAINNTNHRMFNSAKKTDKADRTGNRPLRSGL